MAPPQRAVGAINSGRGNTGRVAAATLGPAVPNETIRRWWNRAPNGTALGYLVADLALAFDLGGLLDYIGA